MNPLREVHAEIDKEFEAESRALDEEYNRRRAELVEIRDRDHAALDRRWTNATGGLETNASGLDDEDNWPAFSADDVQALIGSCQPDEKLNVNWVFRRLIKQDPKLKERKPQIVRNLISRTLLKLVESGVLEFVRKGKGGQPHIYRRVASQAVGASTAGH